MAETKRVSLCPTCEAQAVQHCPEDVHGRKRCGECGARFHGSLVAFVETDSAETVGEVDENE